MDLPNAWLKAPGRLKVPGVMPVMWVRKSVTSEVGLKGPKPEILLGFPWLGAVGRKKLKLGHFF